jgi:signal transduction histidine kinase
MTRRGRPVVIVCVLLLLFTYLLIKSRSRGQDFRARGQTALQALQLSDAALNRAVLMVRSGLLPHYDSLPEIARTLRQQLQALEREGAALAADGDAGVARETQRLTDALSEKRRLIEEFTSNNAVLRNSTTYFAHLVQRLSRDGTGDARALRALAAAHVVMQFVQAPEGADAASVEASLATLEKAARASETSGALAAHGRLIVDRLPLVDSDLREILTTPVAERVEAVQRAMLQSAAAAEARAARFRLLFYCSALVLLAYLAYVFARLRANAAELRRKELQLIQANKMTALGMLVSSVAHEINNPNQIVLTNAGVLATAVGDVLDIVDERGDATRRLSVAGIPYAETRDLLPRLAVDIQESARRIEWIVGDLKHFARPGGRTTEWFNVNDAVQRALRLLTYLVRKRTDALHVKLADHLPAVWGNAQHLEQVTVNLVVNALEALPSRDKGVSVATRHDSAGGRIVLEVRDEGAGMTPSHLARLGEPFFTTREATGGTGLGIAIASSLVRLYDGQLTFASQPGKGTCATVTLPEQRTPLTMGANVA